jgi:hypothetical protein
MRPLLAFLSLLLVPTVSFASTADLRVTIGTAASSVRPGDPVVWRASVENLGPDTARDVRFRSSLDDRDCAEVTLPTLAAGAAHSVDCSLPAAVRFFGYFTLISARADTFSLTSGGDPDPDVANNFAERRLELITPPDLYLSVYAEPRVDPGLPFPVTIVYGNAARTTATGVTLTVDVSAGVGIRQLPANCTAAGQRIDCALGTLAPIANPETPEPRTVSLDLVAPDVRDETLTLTSTIRANEQDARESSNHVTTTLTTEHTIDVTSDADSGEGSLRAAIDTANASCTEESPCKIAFRLPPAGAAWRTIRLRTPLAPLTASGVTIDGTTQTRLFGDTNPSGPEIELTGADVTSGSGLDIQTGCTASVIGLAVNGFPDAGLLLHGPSCNTSAHSRVIGQNYIGTDPTGTTAVPNGRGIVVDSQIRWAFAITSNVVSGNRRSGIFVTGGATSIYRNSIGLGADRRPLGNGASGVYVAPGGTGTDLTENFIGFNHDSGVSIAAGADWVSAHANSFQGNWQLAIDYGLNGVSATVPFRAEHPAGLMHVPEITSARYDPVADRTIVEGTASIERTGPSFGSFVVTVYANDAPDESGFGEGQYVLGTALLENGRFTFTYPGHAPGLWIAATLTNTSVWGLATSPRTNAGGSGYGTTTSEFSRTVRVSE